VRLYVRRDTPTRYDVFSIEFARAPVFPKQFAVGWSSVAGHDRSRGVLLRGHAAPMRGPPAPTRAEARRASSRRGGISSSEIASWGRPVASSWSDRRRTRRSRGDDQAGAMTGIRVVRRRTAHDFLDEFPDCKTTASDYVGGRCCGKGGDRARLAGQSACGRDLAALLDSRRRRGAADACGAGPQRAREPPRNAARFRLPKRARCRRGSRNANRDQLKWSSWGRSEDSPERRSRGIRGGRRTAGGSDGGIYDRRDRRERDGACDGARLTPGR